MTRVLRIEIGVVPETRNVLDYMHSVLLSSLPRDIVTEDLLEKGVPLYHFTGGQRIGTIKLVEETWKGSPS